MNMDLTSAMGRLAIVTLIVIGEPLPTAVHLALLLLLYWFSPLLSFINFFKNSPEEWASFLTCDDGSSAAWKLQVNPVSS